MIYTVTLNPALDYIVHVPEFKEGTTNRSVSQQIFPGGKGLNVSMMLSNLGHESTAYGFRAGFTGDELERLMEATKINSQLIATTGETRINVKIKSHVETEINCSGADIRESDLDMLLSKLGLVEDGDYLVLAGSVPDILPEDIYEQILKKTSGRIIHTIVDTTGQILIDTLQYEPFLIKPNRKELTEIFEPDREPESVDDETIIKYAKQLMKKGAKNVLVSLGGDGALLICKSGRVLKSEAPKGQLVNSVGSGDSMVAGFIAGYTEKLDMEEAFKLGVAAGSASAFSEWLADRDHVDKVYKEVISVERRTDK